MEIMALTRLLVWLEVEADWIKFESGLICTDDFDQMASLLDRQAFY